MVDDIKVDFKILIREKLFAVLEYNEFFCQTFRIIIFFPNGNLVSYFYVYLIYSFSNITLVWKFKLKFSFKLTLLI